MGQEPLSNRDEGAATATIGAGTTGYDDDLMESAAPATDGGGRGASNTATSTAREAAPVYGYPVAYAAPIANYSMGPTASQQTAANRFRLAGTPNQMYHGFIATAFCGCIGMLCSMCGCWTLYGRSGAMFGCAVWLIVSSLFSASQLYVLLANACDDEDKNGSKECMSQGWFMYTKMRLIVVMVISCIMVVANIYWGKKSKRRADSETEQAYMEQQSAQAFIIPTSPLMPRPR